MFERYTEEARRVIFWARYEASAFGCAEISAIHLLLGLLREHSDFLQSFLATGSSIEALRDDLTATQPGPVSQVSTSVDLPLSFPAKKVLAYAGEESEGLEHRHIDLIHLLLALLHDPAASAILAAHGVTREKVLTHATTVMPTDTTLDARFRVSELIRNLPPELLAEAEQRLRGMLTSDSQTRQRRLRFEETGRDIETTRTFCGNEVSVTDTLAPGAELETIDYSITVRAFGEQRSWRTTFRKQPQS